MSYEFKFKLEKVRHGLVSYTCFSIPMFALIRTYANSFNDVCNIIWPRLTLQQIKRISCGGQCHKKSLFKFEKQQIFKKYLQKSANIDFSKDSTQYCIFFQ